MNEKERFLQEEGTAFPGKTYADHLLRHIFNDQRDHLFHEMFSIHRAHVVMLTEQSIISRKEASVILHGIEKVRQIDHKKLQYEPQFEDLFFMMESKLSEEIGADLAGNIHIGRSRNDMGVAMYRLVLRQHILTLMDSSLLLADAILTQAAEHTETVMTAYTHTQPAQPTTLGHYLAALYDMFMRDMSRLWRAYEIVNLSPLGAAALSTTSFPIDRERVRQLLGFNGLVENSYDAIAAADYLIEAATATLSMMTNAGRWIQDFLQQTTHEYGVILVADPYVQISSIMPQKRNPVSIEHSRSLASSSAGEALAAIQMIHNTPFGDIVDTEDDLQPHLYRSYEKANRVVRLMNAVIRTMDVNKETLGSRARTSCITITELADVLAREKKVPFRQAHHIASLVAKTCTQKQKELDELTVKEINELISSVTSVVISEKEWGGITCPHEFVRRRKIQGGPNPDEVKRMIAERKGKLSGWRTKVNKEYDNLKKAEDERNKAVSSLL
ncbi:argininosuccinate lyase [Fictibacillus iocasae]|uniref:Argininosuccinate lyase n=1 Tax=Fictibacillus iocasae TaxID=2715437 RepID=A0ABW2NLE1_9BACL